MIQELPKGGEIQAGLGLGIGVQADTLFYQRVPRFHVQRLGLWQAGGEDGIPKPRITCLVLLAWSVSPLKHSRPAVSHLISINSGLVEMHWYEQQKTLLSLRKFQGVLKLCAREGEPRSSALFYYSTDWSGHFL
jgi:hypothetical protein